jgi:peptidyl-prolyl cis-trans isomerase C
MKSVTKRRMTVDPDGRPAAAEPTGPTEPAVAEPAEGGDAVDETRAGPRRRRSWIVIGVVLLVGLGAGGWGLSRVLGDAALGEGTALRVGSTTITEDELTTRADTLRALYGITDPGGSQSADFRRDMAAALALSLVLDEAAVAMDVSVSERDARQTLSGMVEQQLGTAATDPQAAFTDLLAEFGVTEDRVLEEVARQQSVSLLFDRVTADVVADVDAADAQALYDEDPAAFGAPESRGVRNIVVASLPEARRLLTQLRGGADFAALATRRSLDSSTREAGGSLGQVYADQLDPAYAKAAFSVGVKEVFGPVQSEYGWNVGYVQRIIPAKRPDYDQVADQALQVAQSEAALGAWREWLLEQLQGADVEYADDYRPDDPDQLPEGYAGDPTDGTGAAQ